MLWGRGGVGTQPRTGAKAASVGLGSPWWSHTDAQPRAAWERSFPSDGEQLQLLNPNLLLNSDLQLTEPRDWRQRQGEPEVVGSGGRGVGLGWGGAAILGLPGWKRGGSGMRARPGRWGPRATAFNRSKSCFCGSRDLESLR